MIAVVIYYLVFVSLLAIHIVWYLSEPEYAMVIVIWILCLFGLAYEGYQMYCSGLEEYFFSQIWNYFDLGSFLGVLMYINILFYHGDFENIKQASQSAKVKAA